MEQRTKSIRETWEKEMEKVRKTDKSRERTGELAKQLPESVFYRKKAYVPVARL